MIPVIGLKGYLYAGTILATIGAFTYTAHVFTDRATLKAQVETQAESLRLANRAALATNTALSARAASVARIQTITKEVIREVPVYLPASTPALPSGFRVLHDSAVRGVVPDPASGPDAAPVAAQDAANTIVDNYGTCRDTADQLERLQQWLRGVRAPSP